MEHLRQEIFAAIPSSESLSYTASCLHEVIKKTKDRDAELNYLIAIGIMETATEITLLRHSLIENK